MCGGWMVGRMDNRAEAKQSNSVGMSGNDRADIAATKVCAYLTSSSVHLLGSGGGAAAAATAAAAAAAAAVPALLFRAVSASLPSRKDQRTFFFFTFHLPRELFLTRVRVTAHATRRTPPSRRSALQRASLSSHLSGPAKIRHAPSRLSSQYATTFSSDNQGTHDQWIQWIHTPSPRA